MVRNSGKFGKPKRGGAKRFTPARTLKAEAEDKEGMWEGKNSSDEDEDEEGEEEEEEDSDDSDSEDEQPSSSLPPRASSSTTAAAGPSTSTSATPSTGVDKFGNMPELSAREAKKLAKQERAQKAKAESDSDDSDDDLLVAGRGNAGLTKQMKASSLGSSDTKPSKSASQGMNRREREEAQKKIAREKYLELHRAGKTTEAKADLARLATIRKEREEAAARKAAEKADQDEAKAKALAASGRKR